MTCTCSHIMLGLERTNCLSWSERCEEHGVGTQYFRDLKTLPFGYADERETTREEWLKWLESER
jgi:hypothetical protein